MFIAKLVEVAIITIHTHKGGSRTWFIQALAAFALTAPLAAGAQVVDRADRYVFVGGGPAHARLDCTGDTVCDGSDVAVQFGLGLVWPVALAGGKVAVEGRWVEFGSARLVNAAIEADITNSALLIGARWRRAFWDRQAVSLGAGVARVRTRVAAQPNGGPAFSGTDVRTRPYVSVGLHHMLAESASLDLTLTATRAEYRRSGLDLGSGRLSSINLGVTQAF